MKPGTRYFRTPALLLLSGTLAHSAIIADFTGGNGTESVDQFRGIPGEGWSNAWQTTLNSATLDSSVISANPLNGGGNYLSSTLSVSGAATNGLGVVSRDYDSFGDVDVASMHTISFDIRLDSGFDTFTSNLDYIQIFDRSGSNTDFGSGASWLIRAAGDVPPGTTGLVATNWMVYDGTKDNVFSNTRFVDTGVALVPGAVYRFDVTVDPASSEYTVAINGVTTNSDLGFRAGNTFVSGQLNFGGRVNGQTDESMTFSVDSIMIPEPSAALLVVLGSLPLLGRRRRQARNV